MITIGPLVSEIFMFESVSSCTDGRRLKSHPISSPGAFANKAISLLLLCLLIINTKKLKDTLDLFAASNSDQRQYDNSTSVFQSYANS